MRTAVLAGVGVLLAALLTAAVTVAVTLPALHQAQNSLTASAAASKASVALLGQYIDAETGVRGYVLAGQPVFLNPYRQALAATPGLQTQLGGAVTEDRDAGAALHAALAAFDRWRDGYAQPQLALVAAGQVGPARAQAAAGKQLFDRLRDRVAVLQQLLDRRTVTAQRTVRRREGQLTGWLSGALAVLAVLAVTGCALLLHGVVRPLAQLAAASRRVDGDTLGDTDITAADSSGGGTAREGLVVRGPAEVRQVAAEVAGMRSRLADEVVRSRRAVQALTQHSPAVVALRDALAPGRHAVAGLDVAARLDPAEGVLAGDWYDTVQVSTHQLALVVGDVAGHGPVSAVFALRLKTSLASALRAGLSPAQALGVTAADLTDVPPEMFATAFVAVIDTAAGTLTCANAGHPAAILLPAFGPAADAPTRRAGSDRLGTAATGTAAAVDVTAGALPVVELPATGPLLSPIVTSWAWGQSSHPLHPGDTVFAYTDGVTETRDLAGGQYGTDRLLTVVTDPGPADPAALVAAVAADTQRFAGHRRPADDRTLVCIRRQTIPVPAARRH